LGGGKKVRRGGPEFSPVLVDSAQEPSPGLYHEWIGTQKLQEPVTNLEVSGSGQRSQKTIISRSAPKKKEMSGMCRGKERSKYRWDKDLNPCCLGAESVANTGGRMQKKKGVRRFALIPAGEKGSLRKRSLERAKKQRVEM